MARYKVVPGTQVHYDGTTYAAGDTFEAPDSAARTWLAAGYVTAGVRTKRTVKAKQATSSPSQRP